MKIELDSKNIRVNENKEDLLEDSPRTPEECKARMEEVNEAIKLVSWISSCFFTLISPIKNKTNIFLPGRQNFPQKGIHLSWDLHVDLLIGHLLRC
jgi:hypothetical protein